MGLIMLLVHVGEAKGREMECYLIEVELSGLRKENGCRSKAIRLYSPSWLGFNKLIKKMDAGHALVL